MADSTAAIVVPQCVISTTHPAFPAATDEVSFTPSRQGLLELFLTVSDGRSNQGRDHPVAVVLALVAAATVTGLKGYTAMSGWVADVPAGILDSLYTRVDARPVGRPSRWAPLGHRGLHFIRDTCYREDHSRVRTRSGPRVLASLRNLAINALRLAGRTDITEATRWANRDT